MMGDASAVQTSARAKMKNVKGDMVKEWKGRDRRASVCRGERDGERGETRYSRRTREDLQGRTCKGFYT